MQAIISKTNRTSKRDWLSLQEQVGFMEPKADLKSILLTFDPVDLKVWQEDAAENRCTFKLVKGTK